MKKRSLVTKPTVAVAAFMLLLPLSAAFAQLPEVTTGTCDVTKMSYVTSSANATTPITPAFVDVPDMLLFFDVAEGQCVKIEFSVVLSAPTHGNIEIRVPLDDNPTVLVPDSIEISPGLSLGHHIFTFIVPVESGLGPGSHLVRIQIRGSGGGSLSTRKRSLTVLHN